MYMMIMYYVIARSFLDGEEVSHVYKHGLNMMIFLLIYFSFREIIQIADTISKGSMLHYDLWNIVDFLRILTVTFSIYLFFTITRDDYGTDDKSGDNTKEVLVYMSGDEHIFVTIISLSLAVFKELKIMFLNFAKFVHSVEQISKNLTSFIIALFIILSTFAVCFQFFLIGDGSCYEYESNKKEYNKTNIVPIEFCEVGNYSMWVRMYSFMLNSDFRGTVYDNRLGQSLYVLSTFVTVIVLLNVLIGIICSSYDDSIKNGERAFWINRLKLIDEIDGIKEMLENGFAMIQRKLCLKMSKKEMPNLYHQSEHVDQGHAVWDLLTIAFEDMKFNRKRRMDIVHKFEASGRHIFIEEKMRSKDSRPIITCLIGLVVIPLWFILGVVTFGLLWPLQVRAAIFCPKIIVASTELSSDRFSNTIVMKRVSDQREEKVDFSPSKVFSSLTKEG